MEKKKKISDKKLYGAMHPVLPNTRVNEVIQVNTIKQGDGFGELALM